MKKDEQAARVKTVRTYLESVGAPISSVQGYEVLARCLGMKNKHVLAAQAAQGAASSDSGAASPAGPSAPQVPGSVDIDGEQVPVMGLCDEPFSVERMRELDWQFDVVVPFALDQLESIEGMNDYASKRITGNDSALEDIGFDHVPEVNYGKGWVAYRVNGYVSSPRDVFDEEDQAAEARFYDELAELAQCLREGAAVAVHDHGCVTEEVLSKVEASALDVLQRYASSRGENNEELNARSHEVLFVTRDVLPALHLLGQPFFLGDVKHATKVGESLWNIEALPGHVVMVQFKRAS